MNSGLTNYVIHQPWKVGNISYYVSIGLHPICTIKIHLDEIIICYHAVGITALVMIVLIRIKIGHSFKIC